MLSGPTSFESNVSQDSENAYQIVNTAPEYELKVLTLATAEISQYHGHNSKNVIIPSTIDGKNIVGIGKGAFQHCTTIEYLRLSEGIRYVEDIGFREIPSGPHSEDFSYLSGEVVYSLRNCLLHQGTPNIDNNKITEKRCKMDYFILVINNDEHITSSEFALNHDGARSDCGMKVDLYSLCGKLTRAASDYYHSNKELFDFFQYQLIQ